MCPARSRGSCATFLHTKASVSSLISFTLRGNGYGTWACQNFSRNCWCLTNGPSVEGCWSELNCHGLVHEKCPPPSWKSFPGTTAKHRDTLHSNRQTLYYWLLEITLSDFTRTVYQVCLSYDTTSHTAGSANIFYILSSFCQGGTPEYTAYSGEPTANGLGCILHTSLTSLTLSPIAKA